MEEIVMKFSKLDPAYWQSVPIFVVFYLLLIQVTNWRFGKDIASLKKKDILYFQSAMLASVHGIITCTLACIALARSPLETDSFPPLTCVLLTHSIVYLSIDSYLLRHSSDIVMHLHHWFGLALLISMILQDRAANFMTAIFVLVEPTSPLVNTKIMLETLNRNHSTKLICESYFAVLFMFLRTVPYYKLLFAVWGSPYCFLVVKLLTSINYCLSAYWSYIIFCKLLKSFTKADGDNNLIIASLNSVKNFTNKTTIGRLSLYTLILVAGLIHPIMETYYPHLVAKFPF